MNFTYEINFFWKTTCGEGRIRTQNKAHRPSPRMEKGSFAHQSRLDMWMRIQGGKM